MDAQVTSVVLQALEPAALEASLAVGADLQAERAALEQQWRQRLERAQYQVAQARRRYASIEPENRLVARTPERVWEAALAEQVRLLCITDREHRTASYVNQLFKVWDHATPPPDITTSQSL